VLEVQFADRLHIFNCLTRRGTHDLQETGLQSTLNTTISAKRITTEQNRRINSQKLMENVDQLREEQEETLKYVIENRNMITELLESLKSGEEKKKRQNLPNP
jgi:hypothetical protein